MSRQASVTTAERPTPARRIEVDFFYLDLETCSRCVGSDQSLRKALDVVRPALRTSGVEVELRKTLVETEDQARALRFASSPTIRVNGRDIGGELKETSCADCDELCACEGTTDCRMWLYEGEEYNEAPVALIVDAILGEVYGGGRPQAAEASPYDDVPDNLKRFFMRRSARQAAGKPTTKTQETSLCCSGEDQTTCCEPSMKASCCEPGVQACGYGAERGHSADASAPVARR
ncbi:MAG: DUF2703 domain-containing protein [Actinomycetota bacterium]